MLTKINGIILDPEKSKEGVNINYDLHGTIHDAYSIVHTPINLGISYSGHNVVSGDINVFNWADTATGHAIHGIGFIIKSLF